MWKQLYQDENARVGVMSLSHGEVETPVFMPVGTQATVKGMSPDNLKQIGFQIILANTYHLNLRPGMEIIGESGGLHSFMNWDRNILTDSGGFQVFSLAALRKISEDGVSFRSHIDGSLHMLTPENVIDKQKIMGVDIAMTLDECPPYPSSKSYIQKSMDLTIRWAKKSRQYHPVGSDGPKLFGIVQGGMFHDLRQECANKMIPLDFDGYAFGGLSVGEEKNKMYDIMSAVHEVLPTNKPRYIMGIGTPEDLLEAIDCGVDMFDCVLPSRNARNGTLYTWDGKISIKNRKWQLFQDPIDTKCPCYACQNFSAAYLHHLFKAQEILSLQLNTYHNLCFFYELIQAAKKEIYAKNFKTFKSSLLKKWNK
ncbi:tRNA guanosine(34) transglycosylase Tgt [PVC group bacterium (ex Bugula neritina AB1)]|nr:tRNA guanosine(34) transglycosylase Tgt [PVC group bacterium (ex Bugula neritina AB1)]